jgi:hypothetical protein
MQDLLAMAAKQGIRCAVVYIDDWFLCAPTQDECRELMGMFDQLLAQLGWQKNEAKVEGPVQRIEFLGLILDTLNCALAIPTGKAEKAQARITEVLRLASEHPEGRVSAPLLSSVVGLLTHLTAISPQGGTRLRAAWKAIAAASVHAKWHPNMPWALQTAVVSTEVKEGLTWWFNHLSSNPTRRLWPDESGFLDIWDKDQVQSAFDFPTFCKVVTTDAAGVGWGATLAGLKRWAGTWTEAQATCSSNWRELKAVYLALRLYAPHLAGQRVLARIDNSCAVSYVNRKHGPSDKLSEIAREIHALEEQYGFEVVAVHIAGTANFVADELSRLSQSSYAKREIKPSILEHICLRAGCSLMPVMSATESTLAELKANPTQARLWCPGPHEFFSCIQGVRRAVLSGESKSPQVLMLPVTPHATWWRLLDSTDCIQQYGGNTRLFKRNIRLEVPDSTAPPLVLPAKATVPWTFVLFSKHSQKRKFENTFNV